jgi:hypothetical protein
MDNTLFMQLIQLLIILILGLVTAYVVPFIKTKVSKDQMELLLYYVNIAVKAASQIYSKEQWKEKKEYCMQYIKNIIDEKMNITLSDEEISTLIEGVLNGLKATGELLVR